MALLAHGVAMRFLELSKDFRNLNITAFWAFTFTSLEH